MESFKKVFAYITRNDISLNERLNSSVISLKRAEKYFSKFLRKNNR